MKVKELFTEEAQRRIRAAIETAERNTSGEIRLHLEDKCKEDVMDHAAFIFHELEMHRTAERNGVLIYLALEDRKLAIIGDKGINETVPKGFWNDTFELMKGPFAQGDVISGLEQGVLKAGEQLRLHFPYQQDDVNELSDDISFGKTTEHE